ncbi:MAG: PD-(D/E)XK nuclease family protein [Bacteroidales bacterium]|jgi:CRISPR/Cas system-associated exonuclease Cas4 (RecB family)|nr:PD-(D/E)XK nuclease family protein [Bacteroidales bacterium]
MERFLSNCAEYIYQKHHDELQELCIVFPNQRSGVFFTSYLQKQISGAVISPHIITVNELFSSFSQFQSCEKLLLISILYEIFKKHTKTTESFDEFYFWGEILLSDFNDIDHYLVNAENLFRNIADINDIDFIADYLTQEQRTALEHFWENLNISNNREFHKKHIAIWDKLFNVYSEFKRVLAEKNMSYDGMKDRWIVENLENNSLEFEFNIYYIIGFNVLNTCEKTLFKYLQHEHKVRFLWDFDQFYIEDKKNEAGFFMRENLMFFSPPSDFYFNDNNFECKKNIKLVAVSSVYGQAQEIPFFMKETHSDFKPEFDNTAIVLADESLLYATLGAIPKEIGTVNVTMGYPVKNSVVYGFLLLLINLIKNLKKDNNGNSIIYHRFVTDILNHQFLSEIEPEKTKEFIAYIKSNNRIMLSLNEICFSEFNRQIFAIPENVADYSDYFLNILDSFYSLIKKQNPENKMLPEFIFTVYSAIEKLKAAVRNVIDKGTEISLDVYFRLINQYLEQISVTFEGEPLSGLQVMGILETRCLDFENLIILGLNENKLPKTSTIPSFIPYNIRNGFGLPCIDEQNAMYSYYFYRLIQRAKNVTATYSVVREGINNGELSRYGFQLLYDSNQLPRQVNLDFLFANNPVPKIEIQSSVKVADELLAGITELRPLSPSAINIYLMCSLRFYFRHFMKLPEQNEVKEEIDSQLFGNILHETIEALYRPFVGKVIKQTDLETIQKDKVQIENKITKAILKHYFKEKGQDEKPVEMEGKVLLIFENTKTFLKQLLKIDGELAPFTIESLEENYKTEFLIELNGISRKIWLGGKIDRVDRVNGKLRNLDYKTGYVYKLQIKNLEELFEKDLKNHKKEILQALIYTYILSKNRTSEENITPVIYDLHKLFDENFSPEINWEKQDFNFSEITHDFSQYLKGLIQEILSPENVFTQTQHNEKCRYCPYSKICQRY